MRLIVLADGDVGRRVCNVLRERGVVPAVLVVDDGAPLLALPGTEVLSWSALQSVEVVRRLQSEGLEQGVLAWWPHIVGDDLLGLCSRGFLNLHPSLLPHGRGKDPNVWALVEGTPFGVTIHHVTADVDAGGIAFQRELQVTWLDDGERLHRRAQDAIVDLFAESLDQILVGDVPAIPQGEAVTHRRRELEVASRIDLDEPTTPRRLLDVIRARTYPGHPAAWFDDVGRRYEVRITIEERDSPVDG